ncbi:MAG: MerR family transcriptional regulator [Dehalococcoidales bacterium]|nr:MerR family transcriptional regulator [Dehalococcoidales bacterium]
MSETILQIGELAKKAGVSIRTVRYYEELGLLLPSEVTSGGMRLYREADVTRLRFIRRLRVLRLSLDEIRVALGLEQPSRGRQERVARTMDILLMEQSRAEEQIAALAELKEEVDQALTNVRKCTKCTVEECPETCPRLVYLI